ncbi:MAG: LuxR C-terminal-related transcriptional regulator [Chitinophagaceae bacterium]
MQGFFAGKRMDAKTAAFSSVVKSSNFILSTCFMIKQYAPLIKIGILTATAIILFQVLSLFTLYRYMRLDLYLGIVAVCFLGAGLLLNRSVKTTQPVQSGDAPPSLLTLLTNRELEVLQLIAEGKTNKEIAAAQFVEISTIKTHVNNIYGKLAISNRKEARSRYAELTPKA